ncbi:Rpn family recombination-promoting nuclease/putative transposase [Gloeobacter morelensis]|uniref:Rpn family recombination-promoting nuclease/putative transposase n=1 Tax=Gloeobacter morelensis MG652769 TaxID=2781736 RepID=A0ABY3PQ07_9CYAN|nr:Rpn family recombination-promoting nuclease/putative transposase [Gloeobacter morelensis]UFP95795.1 Rpn family recombination-promoting nuclease/putative transposase [Gloeobacter morelensis MG652769]
MAYDNLCKLLAEQAPIAFATWLLRRPVSTASVLKTELSIEPIRADSVSFLAAEGSILHIEFQIKYDSDPPLPLRMLDYFVRLSRRHRQPIEQVLVLLREPAGSATIEQEYRSENTLHRYRVVCLWEEDPEPLLADRALLPLATLARAPSAEELLGRVARQLGTIEEPVQRRDIATFATILAGLKFDAGLLAQIFPEGMMRESVIFQQILQEGRKAGQSEGRAEGRAEGQLEGERRVLLRQLGRKFGPLPDTLVQQVQAIVDLAQLEQLADAVLDAGSIGDFRSRL